MNAKKRDDSAISSQAKHIKYYVFGRFRDYNKDSLLLIIRGRWDSPFFLETKSFKEPRDLSAILSPATRNFKIKFIRWTIQEDKELKKLYLQTNLSFEKIEKIIGRSVSSLSNRITRLKIKRRFPAKFKCPSKITGGLTRIHAHLCGDGNLYCSKQKDCYGPWARYRKNPYRIKHYLFYNNNNQGLLNEFW